MLSHTAGPLLWENPPPQRQATSTTTRRSSVTDGFSTGSVGSNNGISVVLERCKHSQSGGCGFVVVVRTESIIGKHLGIEKQTREVLSEPSQASPGSVL